MDFPGNLSGRPEQHDNCSGGTASHISGELLRRKVSTFFELESVRVKVNKTSFELVMFKERDCAQRSNDGISRPHFVSLNPNKPVKVE